jgi:hypothetical protein
MVILWGWVFLMSETPLYREGAIWEERVGHVERGWISARERGVDTWRLTVQALMQVIRQPIGGRELERYRKGAIRKESWTGE